MQGLLLHWYHPGMFACVFVHMSSEEEDQINSALLDTQLVICSELGSYLAWCVFVWAVFRHYVVVPLMIMWNLRPVV
jgi:hypothetical protein